MSLVRNVILQKKVLSVLVQVILLQSFACGMQILDKPYQKVSVNSEFLIAAKAGDNWRITSLLAEGADVDAKNNNGLTALHFAAYWGHKEIAELLIENGADINAKSNNGRRVLLAAAKWVHKEIAELLIGNGADVDAKSNSGGTSLCVAARGGYKEIAELLIANGAYINAVDNGGWTALCIAARWGHKEIVELLIANGAYINVMENRAWTSLSAAARGGHKEIAELLIKNGAKVNAKDKDGWAGLSAAALLGHKEITELLIKNGAKVNAKDKNGRTALRAAASGRHKEIAELLIKNGAKVNAKDKHGWTALHAVAGMGRKEIAELFKDALLAQALMKLLQKKQGMILLIDLRLWLHTDYPMVGELQKLAEERKSLLCSTMQNKPLGVSSQTPALLLQEIPLSNDEQEQAHFGEKYTRKFTGLALDGEGLEAVITASMVSKLEEELKCPMYKLFDCIVGTSFGGIVALGLVASKDGDYCLLDRDDLIKFFEESHNDILFEKLKIKNDSDASKQRLNALFKGSRLSDALTRVIVPCRTVQGNQFFVFDSNEAQKKEASDYYIRDIGCVSVADDFYGVNMGLLGLVTASSEYKNKAAELLFKKMKASLHENQKESLHILSCAGNVEDEGHNRVHNELHEELNLRYCRIKPEKIGSFDGKELLAVYKEKGEAAAEKFLNGNESFIRKLQENRARKDKASY